MRQLVTIVRVAAVALFCSALPYAVQAQLAGTYDEILKEAKAEGELHFMASGETFGGQEAMTLLEKAFNEKYGTNITLRFTPGPSMPAMAARLQQEAKSGAAASTDLYLGNLASIALLARENVLADINWAETFPEVEPEMEISKGHGVLVRTSISAIVYNPELVDAESVPTSYDDLVNPEKLDAWKGRLAAPPYHDWLAAQLLVRPRDEVIEYAKKVASLVSGFIRYGEEERVVSGEFAVMASTGDGPGYTAFWQRRGAPLDFVVGIQPAPTDYFQVAVPKNSAHPNAAALFAAFLTTPEAQEIIDSVSFQGSHLSPNTTVAKYIKESGVKLLDPNELAQFFQSAEYRDIYGEMKQIFKN